MAFGQPEPGYSTGSMARPDVDQPRTYIDALLDGDATEEQFMEYLRDSNNEGILYQMAVEFIEKYQSADRYDSSKEPSPVTHLYYARTIREANRAITDKGDL